MCKRIRRWRRPHPESLFCVRGVLLDSDIPSIEPIHAWTDSFMLISLKSSVVQKIGDNSKEAKHNRLPHKSSSSSSRVWTRSFSATMPIASVRGGELFLLLIMYGL